MLTSEIQFIEDELGIQLPAFYIKTMLDYPFAEDSFASEFLLCNSPEGILEYNSGYKPSAEAFTIGTDGGENTYFIKLDEDGQVYVFDLEAPDDTLKLEAATWDEYLKQIEALHEEIRQDELFMAERKRNKKWWQFWIHKKH